MTNDVLDYSGIDSTSTGLMLIAYDGGETVTRGVVAFLKATPSDVRKAFARAGLTAWVPTPPLPAEVAFVRLPAGDHRVIHRETISSTSSGRSTLRMQLQSEPT